MKRISNRKKLLVIPVVVMLALGVYWFNQHRSKSKKVENNYKLTNCIQDQTKECVLLNNSLEYMQKLPPAQLMAYYSKVEELKTYKDNPNLLYICTVYYINIEDSKNASACHELLKVAYAKSGGYDPLLSSFAIAPDALQSVVDSLKLNNSQVQNNSRLMTEPQ